MGGVTKRSGSKSPSDPLMLSRFEELRVCMLTYCGNNSRITIAANAGANRFSVIHKLWDDVTDLDLTVKPRLNQRLLFAAATGSFDLCPPGAFLKLGSMEEQDAFKATARRLVYTRLPIRSEPTRQREQSSKAECPQDKSMAKSLQRMRSVICYRFKAE